MAGQKEREHNLAVNAPGVTLPVFLSQHHFAQFPCATLRKRVGAEINAPWQLESCQALAEEGDQFLFGEALARLEDDNRHGHLAPLLIGSCYHRAFEHRGM